MNSIKELKKIISIGEGQSIEFKESPKNLDKEIVAFANATGGVIYCGISDSGEIVGTTISNKIKSEIQDIARNCDPAINIKVESVENKVISVKVGEGYEKPYQCSGGFYLRIGANSQKLRTSEVKELLNRRQSFFDNKINQNAKFKVAFSKRLLEEYCALANITYSGDKTKLLESLSALGRSENGGEYHLTNAGVLLFCENPDKYIPESYMTIVRYEGTDKFHIKDRIDIRDDVIKQIEYAMNFINRHTQISYEFTNDARRIEKRNYPSVALREAIINAVVHRDYSFQNSNIYINMYADRIEIENPGGIPGGVSAQDIEGRSLRRNPVLADLLFRAGYGEKLGSGLTRISSSLQDNNNPSPEFSVTNFFSIRFYPAILNAIKTDFTANQLKILTFLRSTNGFLSSSVLAAELNVSATTITREIKGLLKNNLVIKSGEGKGTRYGIKNLP